MAHGVAFDEGLLVVRVVEEQCCFMQMQMQVHTQMAMHSAKQTLARPWCRLRSAHTQPLSNLLQVTVLRVCCPVAPLAERVQRVASPH